MKSDVFVDENHGETLLRLANRRKNFEPIAYIVGEQDFYGRRFEVNPSVLIPRPETELLVEKAILAGKELIDSRSSLTIMDLGTGSGIIAITLLKELESATLIALDQSYSAIQTAKINALNHGVLDRLSFVASDWFSAIAAKRSFDIILSNPPYVAENAKENLQIELGFEPEQALFSGLDGTQDLRYIINNVGTYLSSGGLFMSEIGYDQKEFVLDAIGQTKLFSSCDVFDDYAGLPRIVHARVK